MLPIIQAGLPPALEIHPLADQSVFVNAASSVVREGLIAACLTGIMILVSLGSWRSTLIIAVSIPLAVLTSSRLLAVWMATNPSSMPRPIRSSMASKYG